MISIFASIFVPLGFFFIVFLKITLKGSFGSVLGKCGAELGGAGI